MDARNQPQSHLRFEEFDLDLGTRELRNNGHRLILQEQPYQILAALLEHPGQLVTREELRRRLWPPDTHVDFERSLNKAVNRLREVLSDSSEGPRFIETLPRQGYRFIAPVKRLDNGSDRQANEAVAGHSSSLAENRKLAAGIVIGALLISMAAFLAWRAKSSGKARVAAIRSIAVMPLENVSGDPMQDYFADGMTDQLITDLSQIGALRVISRTSVTRYKGMRKSLPEIARELNVDAVVEGAVLRSGDRVRITAQLIQADSDRHLWAHAYEGNLSDVLGLQDSIAADIADQIRIKLTPQERVVLRNTQIANPAAYEAYVKGRYFWDHRSTEGFAKAIGYFEEAVREDPNFALPYSGLAEVYASLPDYVPIPPRESFGKSKVAAEKALELDQNLAEAHTALGGILLTNDYDWEGSEREFQRAIELNPGYSNAHHWHAMNMGMIGKWDEAIAEIQLARQLDPLSVIVNANLGLVYYQAHRLDDAINWEHKALELDPENPVAYEYLGLMYLEKRMYGEAVAKFRKAVDLSGGASVIAAELSFAYAASGERAEALKILTRLEARSRHEYVSAFSLAIAHAGLGNKNEVLSFLQKAYDERCSQVPMLKVSPLFDSLHSDTEFQALLERIGFPS